MGSRAGLAVLAGAAVAASCSGFWTSSPDHRELVVEAAASALLTRDTLQLGVRTSDGKAIPPGEVTWISDNPAVAIITADGRLIGAGEGVARVTARRNGVDAEEWGDASFTVWLGRGGRVQGMASYDRLVPELMASWGIEGGAVAVARSGRLVYARSFGYADVAANRPVEPASRFRIASVSKPITAAAVLVLVERGVLTSTNSPLNSSPTSSPRPAPRRIRACETSRCGTCSTTAAAGTGRSPSIRCSGQTSLLPQ